MNIQMTTVRCAMVFALLTTGFGAALEDDGTDHVGTWIVNSQSSLGEVTRVLVIDDNNEGWYGMPDAKFPIRDVSLENGSVSFAVTIFIEAAGGDVPLKFRGSFEGDALKGNFYDLETDGELAVLTGARATEDDLAGNMAEVAARAAAEVKAAEAADIASASGDYDITLSVKKFNGESATGYAYEVRQMRQDTVPFEVTEGTIPPSGILEFTGLAGGDDADSRYFLAVESGSVTPTSPGRYFRLDGKETQRHVEIVLPCVVGDRAPNFNFVDAATGERVDLESFRGKVVFLDFWASWCPPCQEPMARNNELLGRRNDWKGKATILAISVDDTPELARDHMAQEGWTNVPSFWAPEEPGAGVAFQSKAVQTYGVTGIPDTFLIDQEGIIRARGHRLEPEALIDELLGG